MTRTIIQRRAAIQAHKLKAIFVRKGYDEEVAVYRLVIRLTLLATTPPSPTARSMSSSPLPTDMSVTLFFYFCISHTCAVQDSLPIYGSSSQGPADTVSFRDLAWSGDEDDDDSSDGSISVPSDSESHPRPYFIQCGIRRRPLPPAQHPVPDKSHAQVRDKAVALTVLS